MGGSTFLQFNLSWALSSCCLQWNNSGCHSVTRVSQVILHSLSHGKYVHRGFMYVLILCCVNKIVNLPGFLKCISQPLGQSLQYWWRNPLRHVADLVVYRWQIYWYKDYIQKSMNNVNKYRYVFSGIAYNSSLMNNTIPENTVFHAAYHQEHFHRVEQLHRKYNAKFNLNNEMTFLAESFSRCLLRQTRMWYMTSPPAMPTVCL